MSFLWDERGKQLKEDGRSASDLHADGRTVKTAWSLEPDAKNHRSSEKGTNETKRILQNYLMRTEVSRFFLAKGGQSGGGRRGGGRSVAAKSVALPYKGGGASSNKRVRSKIVRKLES